MFKFFKKLIKKNKKSQIVLIDQSEKALETSSELQAEEITTATEPSVEIVNQSSLENVNEESENVKQYKQAMQIAQQIKGFPAYSKLGDELLKTLSGLNINTFVKSELSDFLKNAEVVVNRSNNEMLMKKQSLADVMNSVYAVEEIIRIEKLISESEFKIEKLSTSLKNINNKIVNLEDQNDILSVLPDYSTTYELVKSISYALKLTFDNIELLIDKDSQYESLKFYSKRYDEFNSVYNNIAARLKVLEEKQQDLNNKLEGYKAKAASLSGRGLINIDWDGNKVKMMNRLRNQLNDGYEQLEKGCELIIKNVRTIIENLINSNSELIDYIKTLKPKLTENTQAVMPKYNVFKQQADTLKEQLDFAVNELTQIIQLFNQLY